MVPALRSSTGIAAARPEVGFSGVASPIVRASFFALAPPRTWTLQRLRHVRDNLPDHKPGSALHHGTPPLR